MQDSWLYTEHNWIINKKTKTPTVFEEFFFSNIRFDKCLKMVALNIQYLIRRDVNFNSPKHLLIYLFIAIQKFGVSKTPPPPPPNVMFSM